MDRWACRTLWAATVSGILLVTACVGVLTQFGEETSLISKAPAFDPTVLEREQVAVLSAVVGFGLEGYSHVASQSLTQVLARGPRPLKVIPTREMLSRLNREGLATEYAGMVSEYLRSGILNRSVLVKVGHALDVGYVFQPNLAGFSQFTSSRLSVLGLRIFQTRISTMRLSVQLWETRSGEMVWEASGEATLATEDVREFRIPFEEIAARLWGRMPEDLWK